MKNIGIIGVGSLGKRFVGLFCRNNLGNFLTVSDINQNNIDMISEQYDIEGTSNKYNIRNADILFLTVKPNEIKNVCNDINYYQDNHIGRKKIIVSAAAGVPTEKISEWLKDDHHVVRCMPNIPISEGDGSIAWYVKNKDTNKDYENHIKELETIAYGPNNVWVNKEELIDVSTAVSGCLPAYISKLFEVYRDIGTELGLSESEIDKMLKGAFSGTSKLLSSSDPEIIMREVASKGGATEKGLEMLDNDGFNDIIKRSVMESIDRINNIKNDI
jgi:pyrroline-5-carboxylate reductase